MAGSTQTTRFRFWRWLIKFIGVIAPRRFRARFRREWEAELEYREELLARWDRLDWRSKLELLWRSLGAFWDALWLQQLRWEDEMIQDIRYGARMLRTQKSFTVVAVLSLALGIGANTAIFQLLDAVRLRTLPVKAPQELAEARLTTMSGTRGDRSARYPAVTNPIWEQLRERQQGFSSICAWSPDSFNIARGGEARNARALWVSGDFFNALGVQPRLGRVFTATDDQRGCGARNVVISHALWQREYGGAADVIGRKLMLGDDPFEIIGVTPANFFGLEVGRSFDLALPICAEAITSSKNHRLDSSANWWLMMTGRLKPGWSLEQATAQSKLIPLGFLVVLLWAPTGGAAQSNAQAGGAEAANLTAKVDALFANYNKPDSPGCAVGVIKDGKLVYARGYGMANLEHNIPNGPQIVYDIGSVSKQFTAASILLLAAQGKLSLDDDAHKYIPELPAYQKPITIRQMLHHTSGLRDYAALFTLAGSKPTSGSTTEDDAFKIIVRQKGLDTTPGDDFLYTNSGYFLSSIIVKRVSGKPLAEFAKERIFDPLGMKSTLILDNRKRIAPRRATGYSAARGIFQIEMSTSSDSAQTGDGAVQTSIEDLLRWDQNFYEPKVGGQTLVEQMQTVGALNNGQKMDYALALFVDEYKGLRRVWHEGVDAGYHANLTRFPDQKFSVACLCNIENANSTQLALRVADLYLADQFKAGAAPAPGAATNPAPITLTEGELKPKVGLYRSPASGQLRRITLRDGKLRMDFFGRNSFELAPLGAERFRVPPGGNLVTFEHRPDGKLQLRLTRRGGVDRRSELFEPVAAAAPKEGELVEYAGSYYSEELDTVYHLQVENGALLFSHRNGQKRPLQPTFRDGFTNPDLMKFEFKRDAQGKITGFTLGMARLHNLIFARQK